MAYCKDKNQNKVPLHHYRYSFDIFCNRTRHRQKIVCQPSEVKELYRKWERERIDFQFTCKTMLFEIFDEYLDHCKQAKSEKIYKSEFRSIRIFKIFIKNIKVMDFKRFHIEDFTIWRRNNSFSDQCDVISNATINRDIAALSCFFNYCIKREYYNKANPCFRAKLKENNIREINLREDQLSELLTKAEAQGAIYSALLLALLAGLRRNEIFSLHWSYIDFSRSMLNLPSEITKGNKNRIVCMPDFLRDHLHELKKQNPFVDRVLGAWRTLDKFRIEWEKLRDKLSFKRLNNGLILHFHDLRHIYAQSLVYGGVSLTDVKVFMGHSSVQVTESRYAQYAGYDALEKVNKIQNIIPLRKKVQ